jgi:hypothetical protein
MEIKAVESDQGRYLGYCRLVGRRCIDPKLEEPIGSIPAQYKKFPVFRSQS